jgi:hypothetical protein
MADQRVRAGLSPIDTPWSCASTFDDRPQPRTSDGLPGAAAPSVPKDGAGRVEAVLLLGDLGQLALDHLPPRSSRA